MISLYGRDISRPYNGFLSAAVLTEFDAMFCSGAHCAPMISLYGRDISRPYNGFLSAAVLTEFDAMSRFAQHDLALSMSARALAYSTVYLRIIGKFTTENAPESVPLSDRTLTLPALSRAWMIATTSDRPSWVGMGPW